MWLVAYATAAASGPVKKALIRDGLSSLSSSCSSLASFVLDMAPPAGRQQGKQQAVIQHLKLAQPGTHVSNILQRSCDLDHVTLDSCCDRQSQLRAAL